MKVCLDAGHATTTPGKRTPRFEDSTFIHEAEQNYPIMFKTAEILKLNGIDVTFTNEDMDYDMSLSDRVKQANLANPDIFISIHKNAMTGTWQEYAKGIETFCYKFGYNGEKLAKKVQDQLIADTNLYNRGVKEANFYVIKYTDMPAILVELGFMDYKEEALQMKNEIWHIVYAKAIAKGVCDYFGIEFNDGEKKTTKEDNNENMEENEQKEDNNENMEENEQKEGKLEELQIEVDKYKEENSKLKSILKMILNSLKNIINIIKENIKL